MFCLLCVSGTSAVSLWQEKARADTPHPCFFSLIRIFSILCWNRVWKLFKLVSDHLTCAQGFQKRENIYPQNHNLKLGLRLPIHLEGQEEDEPWLWMNGAGQQQQPYQAKEGFLSSFLSFIWRNLPWWPWAAWEAQESTCQCKRHGFDPLVRKIPWRRKWLLQYFPWRISWTEKPGGLQFMGSQRVRHDDWLSMHARAHLPWLEKSLRCSPVWGFFVTEGAERESVKRRKEHRQR